MALSMATWEVATRDELKAVHPLELVDHVFWSGRVLRISIVRGFTSLEERADGCHKHFFKLYCFRSRLDLPIEVSQLM